MSLYILAMKLFRIKYLAILVSIVSISVLYAGAKIAEPGVTARSNAGNVYVTWQTLEETNLKHFVVERKTKEGGFMQLGEVLPESDKYYEYIDETAYKTAGTLYIYRVAIIDNNGTITYSNEVPVLHDNISSVKKTWGSIKALFR